MTDVFAATKRDESQRPDRASRHDACAMQQSPGRSVATCARAGVLGLGFVCVLLSNGVAAPAPFAGPLQWPLEGAARPLRGGFGEARSDHFHAGLDVSTGGHTGARVLAPAAVTLDRVRTSGAGFGRALYLRTADDRLIVFGHLDAFEPALAAWVDSTQRATGQYEQDLTPPPGRFRYAAGTQVAWSGESGAGPPHLHVEVRHSDFALNPLLAGLGVPDTVPPSLDRVVLEPLDEHSFVERGAAPYTLSLRPRAAARKRPSAPVQPGQRPDAPVPPGQRPGPSEDTLVVTGRIRLTLVASDATNGASRLPVRSVGARWNGDWVECRMDSVSWAGEMSQTVWLLDSGRVTGSDGAILDAPAGIRPRFLLTSRPATEAIELVKVADGAAARPLELYAVDAAGNESVRRVWLRGPQWHELGPDTTRIAPAAVARRKSARRAAAPAPEPRWRFACLPEQRVRISVANAPPGLRRVRIERGGQVVDGASATWDGKRWTAVLFINGLPDPDGYWIKGTLPDGKAWWHRGAYALWPTASPMVTKVEDWAAFMVDPDMAYEPGVVMVRTTPITGVQGGGAGIRAAVDAQPADLPLRGPVTMTLKLPAGLPREHTGLCRRDGDGDSWQWTDAIWDSTSRTFRVETLRLGQFALVRDDAPPEVTLLPARTRVAPAAYPHWEYRARLVDRTSGIAGRACVLMVDGERVPTEWDSENRILRWRPLRAPAPGRHEVRLDAVDRAGNHAIRSGSFVIVSR